MLLSVVVPVRNEGDTIVTLLERLRAVECGIPKEIIVVDGASTDGTREALHGLSSWPELVLAVRTGFEQATGDILMVQDADLELDPSQIPMLLGPILNDGASVVFGSRFKGRGRGDTRFMSYAGNKLLTWSANVLFVTHLTDILTCYKVVRADVARTLDLRCDGFDIDSEITCRLLHGGHRIIELPVRYDPRTVDEGKKLTSGAGWSVMRAILRVRFSKAQVSADEVTLPVHP
jgi:glycosyltransferase involved in cell wall biosynthesis